MKALRNTVLPLVLLTMAGTLVACGDGGGYGYGYESGPAYQGYYYAPAPSYSYSYGYYRGGDYDDWHWRHHHRWWHDND